MSDLKWTRTAPTVPGWYWMRHQDSPGRRRISELGHFYSNSKRLFAKLPGGSFGGEVPAGYEWAGPIPPPVEEPK